MLAQRTDEVIGEFIAFVDVTAYLTYPALLAFCLGLRLNLVLIVGVGHGLLIGHDSGLGHRAWTKGMQRNSCKGLSDRCSPFISSGPSK